MSDETFELPIEAKQVIAELIECNMSNFRDAIGVVDRVGLINRVADILKNEEDYRAFFELINAHAFLATIAIQVNYYFRHSKSNFAIHHREHSGFEEKRRKNQQRRYVTYRNASGVIVRKERGFLTKRELLDVARYYRTQIEGAQDVVDWCQEAWTQMDLLGLGDDAVVGEVLTS